MVIQQSAKDAAVLATFVLVLMIHWVGVTGDNRRRSRETSGDDDLLELETSREPFRNDEELVSDSFQQELRGSEQSENIDADDQNQEIQQDHVQVEPELQEEQLIGEREGGAKAQRTELETLDDQQLQLGQYADRENYEDESQHTRRETKENLQLQQQQQLSNDEIGQNKDHQPLLKMEESRQLQKGHSLNEKKGETRLQRAEQEVGEDQQTQKKSPNEENDKIKFSPSEVGPKDKQQLQQEQLASAEKNTVVLQHVQPETKEDQQLQREQLPNGMKDDTGVQHDRLETRAKQQDILPKEQLTSPEQNTVMLQHAQPEAKEGQQLQHEQLPNVMKGNTVVPRDRLETRDSHELQQDLLPKEGNSEVRARDGPVEMEEVNQQLSHIQMSEEQKDKGRTQRAQLETEQKWKMQGQQLANEEKVGKSHRNVKFGIEENHQQNQERGAVEGYLGKLEGGAILQHYQNQFDSVQRDAVGIQHGQLAAKDLQQLQQKVGKGTIGGQVDVEQQQLQQLATIGQLAEPVRHNQEVRKLLKPDEVPGVWMKSGNMGKVADLVHSGPPSVERLHPNEHTAVANSGHVDLPASETLATSKQRIQSDSGAVVQADVQMPPTGTAETHLMDKVDVGEDETHPREPIDTVDSTGWQQSSKVEETEARVSDTHHGAEASSGTAETDIMHNMRVSEDEIHPRERIDTIDSISWQRPNKLGGTEAGTSGIQHGAEPPSGTAETDLMHNVRVSNDETHPRERIGTIDNIGWQQTNKLGEVEARVSNTHHGADQWLQTAGRKSVFHVQQESPTAVHRDRPVGIEMRQRPQGEMQSGMQRQHLRKPTDGSHHAHLGMEKVKKRTRSKAVSLEQLRARRRNKAAATADTRAQRQQLHRALPRPQRQQESEQYEPGDVLRAAVLASLASTETPTGNLDLGVSLPVAPELEMFTTPSVEGEPVGRVAVVLVSSPTEASVGLPSTSMTLPLLEVDTSTTTSTSTSVSASTNTSGITGAETLLPTSESEAVALQVLQGVQRRAQKSERMRQQILPSLRSSPPPAEAAAAAAAAAAGGRPAPCNATGAEESVQCQRRRLLDRALRAVKQLQRLEERGLQCPVPRPEEREFLRKLLQYAPGPAAGHGDLSRRIRHLRRLVADYEKLTAAEKEQVRGVRDYLARQLSRLYGLSQASTLPPPASREETEAQSEQQPEAQLQVVRAPLEGKEAAATALLERLRRHSQLPPRPAAVQRRLQRRLASRPRRDAYAQLAVSAADARFRMPAV